MLGTSVWGQSGTSVKDHGSNDLASVWGTKDLSEGLGALGLKGLKPYYYTTLYHMCRSVNYILL